MAALVPLLVALPLVAVPLAVCLLLGRTSQTLALLGASAVSVLAMLIFFDPLLDRRCTEACESSPWAFLATSSSESLARLLFAALPVVFSLIALGLVRSLSRVVQSAVIAAAVWSGVRAVAILTTPTSDLGYVWNLVSAAAALLALTATLVAVAWPSVQQIRVRARVAKIVETLTDANSVDDVGEAVARALGDPAAEIRYRTPTGWVDARGCIVTEPPIEALSVRRVGREVASIVGIQQSKGEIPPLGPTLELALANEALRALALSHIAELRETRARIVAAGDEARRALERNLHDGAQTRLVALSFELRRNLALAAQPDRDIVDDALGRTSAALADLRRIAHGIFPTTLTDAGLCAALNEFAYESTSPVDVTCVMRGRLPLDVEMAAYRFVTESVGQRTASVSVDQRTSGELVVRVESETDSLLRSHVDEWDAQDRIGALGGSWAVHVDGELAQYEAVVPCAW